MSIITKVLKQKCVYWAKIGNDEFGQPAYGAAIELDCRWSDKVEQIVNSEGAMVVSKTKVMVSVDVVIGGILIFSELASVQHLIEPQRNTGAYEIIQFDKVPNFKCTEFLRTAYL